MKIRIILLFILCQLFLAGSSFAQKQVPLGTWRTYLPYNKWTGLTIAGEDLYATANDRSLIKLNLTDNNPTPLSKADGLSGVDYTKIKYNEKTRQTLIAYTDANIDIIESDGSISNLNDIKNKQIIGSKSINNIYFDNELAFISTDFGLIVINLLKKEVKESYTNIGPNGSSLKVYSCGLNQNKDSLYVVSDKGLMVAPYSKSVNLLDYSNWYTFTAIEGVPSKVKTINNLNGTMYAGDEWTGIYYYTNKRWQKTNFPVDYLLSANSSSNKLLFCMNHQVLIVSDTNKYERKAGESYNSITSAEFDNNGNLWVADQSGGGLFKDANGTITKISISSPKNESTFRLNTYGNKLVVCGGGYSGRGLKSGMNGQYFIFENGEWTISPVFDDVHYPYTSDIINSTYNPITDRYYFASLGQGIVTVKNNTFYVYNSTNSPLVNPYNEASTFIMTADVKTDKDGTVWILDSYLPSSTTPALYALRRDSTWKTYTINHENIKLTLGLFIDSYNQKWIRCNPGQSNGLFVYNEKTNVKKFLSKAPGSGNLPNDAVTCLAEDKKGDMWIGTQAGIAIIYDASNVLNSSTVDAVTPIFEGFPLLYQEIIKSITVDGGNRKWIGTENGLWLLNETGLEVIYHFTAENSPLLSNIINDVAIMETTGEVFIATDKGLISFRGEATEASDQFGDVKIFPNPVPPSFTGTVGISGLAANANIKITDIYGNLIFQTKAAGGMATWNGRNYNGKRAETGTYLVFASSENGEEAVVAKIAVIE